MACLARRDPFHVSVRAAIAAAGALTGEAAAETIDFTTYRPSFEAARISRDEAPLIDGDLSDPAWAKAAVIDDFYQTDPTEGAAPTERTRAFVMFDERHLYVAIYAYDSEPDRIGAKLMTRDAEMGDGDAVRVVLDPFGTRRDGYYFAMNPNGARADALAENNNNFLPEWDAIWNGDAKIVEDGWIAEFAIPFRSISFDPSRDGWGFQIVRNIRRKNEWIRWSNVDRTRRVTDLTNVGEMRGIEPGSPGLGLDVQAYATGQWARDWTVDPADDVFKFKPSGNAYYRITPGLTGTLTFNTDFSDTPLDERQVNTGRFNLFFPETRDFFLQDAAVFAFGGRVFNSPNGKPFFSRRIGLADGAPADILAGAKVSGQAGPIQIGALSTRTKSTATTSGQVLSAVRASVPVLKDSRVGVIVTNGDPLGLVDNTVAGVDFQYKNTDLIGTDTFSGDFAYVRSWQDNGERDFVGTELAYRADKWNWTMRARQIDEGFDPRLGFVNRDGIRQINPNGWRTIRPENSFIRLAEVGGWASLTTDLDNTTLDRNFGLWIGGIDNAGDEAWYNYENLWTNIQAPFSIAGRVPVAAGEYHYVQHSIDAFMTSSRPVAIGSRVRWGDIYDGKHFAVAPRVNLRPSKHFTFSAEYEFLDFDLPSGSVGIHIGSVESSVNFSPRLQFVSQIQYDNISENFSYFGRLRWEPRPETEILFAISHTALVDADPFLNRFESQGTSATIRLGHTLRK